MRKKLIIAALVLLVLVGAFAGVVAMQPNEFRIERSITIAAPPAEVFPQVNDFHNWEAWSPWAKLDPGAKNSFEGPESGKGAIFKWSGNDKVGEGIMTLTESHPNTLIQINLEFIKPFAGSNTAEFTFKPIQGATPEVEQAAVTWSMFGKSNFMHKAICLFMNMDKMVGGDFERGLASMKAEVEAAHQKEPEEPTKSKKATPEH